MAEFSTRVDVGDDSPQGSPREADIRGDTVRIAALENIPTHPRNLLPPLEDGIQSQGGLPDQSGVATISVPHGGGSFPMRAGDTTIAMQGRPSPYGPGPKQKPLPQFRARPNQQANSIEMVVYFQDKQGLHLTCEDGQHMEAGELFEIVMEEMKYPAEFREVFSLWLVSDLLELQLKPNHVPFKLVCYWEELLEKYTTVDEDDRERDEPVIMFQRNVFYPKWKERDITNPEAIRLLCYEAKEMVIDGRYPLKPEQYDYLAGLTAQIKHKSYDADVHTPEYYRDHLADYYPEHMAHTKWKFKGIVRDKKSPEFRIASCHRQCHEMFSNIDSQDVMLKLYQSYMKFVWQLSFYGAAFFRGQIEHPGGSIRLWTLDDDPVWIAVNTDGVFILDMDDVQFLVGLPYQKLSWEYGEPKDKDNPDCMPCLFISWGAMEESKPVTKMLQIFSKEAMLADSMIEACIVLKQQEKSSRDMESYKNDLESIVQSSGETWQRFNRMCLATFSRKGSVIKNPARVPKQN